MKAHTDTTWQAFNKQKTPDLRSKLMTQYLGLVHYVVNRSFKSLPGNTEREDLVNIGVIGLSEALDRYNPELGIKFETYAIPRIRGAIIDELRKQDWMPRSMRAKSNKIKKAMETLEQSHYDNLNDQLVAKSLGLNEEEYRHWQSQLATIGVVSLDKTGTDEKYNLYEAIEDVSLENALKKLETKELHMLLVDIIKTLPERPRLAIVLYYYEKLTFKEIGTVLNVSESRISQIHSETIKKMKMRLLKAASE